MNDSGTVSSGGEPGVTAHRVLSPMRTSLGASRALHEKDSVLTRTAIVLPDSPFRLLVNEKTPATTT